MDNLSGAKSRVRPRRDGDADAHAVKYCDAYADPDRDGNTDEYPDVHVDEYPDEHAHSDADPLVEGAGNPQRRGGRLDVVGSAEILQMGLSEGATEDWLAMIRGGRLSAI